MQEHDGTGTGGMDHRAFVTSLDPAVKASLTARSDGPALWHLAGHLGLIVGVGALVAMGVPGWPLLLPVQGMLIVFLFTLEHEATHKTPFANTPFNEWVGRACGFVLLLPFEWFRYFHAAHHRWTNIEGMDPELDGGRPETASAWGWHVTGLPFWAANVRLIFRLVAGGGQAAWMPDGALARAQAEARWMLAGYGLLGVWTAFNPVLLWVWIVPALLGQPFLRLYLLAEHGDCPRVADMLRNTRTTFTTRLVRFLAWNMPFHTEHHVFPAVPFHRLPQLHALMKEELKVTAEGYASFTRAYLARRL